LLRAALFNAGNRGDDAWDDDPALARGANSAAAELRRPLHVQIDRDRSGHNADLSFPPSHLHALEEEIAGRIRIQEAARPCDLADSVLHRMRDRLFGRKIDLSVLVLTAHPRARLAASTPVPAQR
jgi:hypothetical protein